MNYKQILLREIVRSLTAMIEGRTCEHDVEVRIDLARMELIAAMKLMAVRQQAEAGDFEEARR